MSSRYDWICSSEDSVHYDTEDIIPLGAYLFRRPEPEDIRPPREPREDYYSGMYPAVAPYIANINITNTTEITQEVSDEHIQNIVDNYVPTITENVIDEIGDNIVVDVNTETVDEAVDEIYGGSAEDVLKESDTP